MFLCEFIYIHAFRKNCKRSASVSEDKTEVYSRRYFKMFGSIGPSELIIIMLIVLLLFGSKRLPELARGIGKATRQFKKALDDVKEEINLDDIDREIRG